MQTVKITTIFPAVLPVLCMVLPAHALTGAIMNANLEPLCGCAVSLVNNGASAITANGSFAFSVFPNTHDKKNKNPVTVDLFSLDGRLAARKKADELHAGTFREIFPDLSVNAAYIIRLSGGTASSTAKLLPLANDRLRDILHGHSAERLTEVNKETTGAIDTIAINCPGMAAKKIAVTSYSADIGTVILAARAAAAVTDVVFVTRNPPGDSHWYANFGYYGYDSAKKAYSSQGRLCKVNLQTKEFTVLLADLQGCMRDPQISYDGSKILFSYRKAGSDYFNLYEIHTNGTGLRQITGGPFDDIEPTYLPDGGIAFCSSRAKRWVNCWTVQVATIHRCSADGTNIRLLSANIEQDNTPWPLPDGRLLYTRWEYVDRSQMRYHHLWYMNPDGTNQMVYYGNFRPDNVFIDAKPIPGTDPCRIVMIHSYGHGRTEHQGDVTLLRSDLGPDDKSAEKIISAGGLYRDPYPVSSNLFLVAKNAALYTMDSTGKVLDSFMLPANLAINNAWLHEPRPIIVRPREPALAHFVNLSDSTGTLLVLDAYIGRNMTGVARGDIKKLLVLETLPKPVNFAGQMEPVSYGGTFTMNRILGTVPVESDGSAYLRLPANRSFFFVALDQNDLSIKRMQSFLTVMPGENSSCIGCHEERTMTTPNLPTRIALTRAPVAPAPVSGMPQVFDYPRDIQPVWNKYCLNCHDVDKHEGGVFMTGDNGPMYTLSYFELSARLQMSDGRDESRSSYPPRTLGSSASPLMKKVDGSHHGVVLTAQELRKIKLWIDASAHFPGTYAALGWGTLGIYQENSIQRPDINWPTVVAARKAMTNRCSRCHTIKKMLPSSPSDDLGISSCIVAYNGGASDWDAQYTPPWLSTDTAYTNRVGSTAWMKKYADSRLQFHRHRVYNLTRPEKSLILLAPLAKAAGGYETCGPIFTSTNDTAYQRILASIKSAKAYVDSITRFNMPVFHPRPDYVREMIRYGALPAGTKATDPIDVYATDEKYWKSLWWKPVTGTGVLPVKHR
jgi:hypothetical protein